MPGWSVSAFYLVDSGIWLRLGNRNLGNCGWPTGAKVRSKENGARLPGLNLPLLLGLCASISSFVNGDMIILC
jgi:hypothetical protein